MISKKILTLFTLGLFICCKTVSINEFPSTLAARECYLKLDLIIESIRMNDNLKNPVVNNERLREMIINRYKIDINTMFKYYNIEYDQYYPNKEYFIMNFEINPFANGTYQFQRIIGNVKIPVSIKNNDKSVRIIFIKKSIARDGRTINPEFTFNYFYFQNQSVPSQYNDVISESDVVVYIQKMDYTGNTSQVLKSTE